MSSEKSLCPGVSSRLNTTSSCSKRSTVDVTEMPRRFSTSIQSDVAAFWPLRAVTEPASPTAPAYSSSFSVSVVLPASGCEMIANVRRRAASCNNCVSATVLIGPPGYEGARVRSGGAACR